MRKNRIYLDTSVISHIDAPHKPIQEAVTKVFYRILDERADEYELFISPVVILEVDACPEPKQTKLVKLLQHLNCSVLPESQEVNDLVRTYIEEKVLDAKHYRDLTHIAYAVIARCDYIVSWNFKHFVNPNTISRVNTVNRMYNYSAAYIVSPHVFTGELTDEND